MCIRVSLYTIQWILTLTIAVLLPHIVVNLLSIVVVLLPIAVNDLHFTHIAQGLQRCGDLFGSFRFYLDLIIGSNKRITLKTEG